MQLQEVPEVSSREVNASSNDNFSVLEFPRGRTIAYYAALASMIVASAVSAPDLQTAAFRAICTGDMLAVVDHFKRNKFDLFSNLRFPEK